MRHTDERRLMIIGAV